MRVWVVCGRRPERRVAVFARATSGGCKTFLPNIEVFCGLSNVSHLTVASGTSRFSLLSSPRLLTEAAKFSVAFVSFRFVSLNSSSHDGRTHPDLLDHPDHYLPAVLGTRSIFAARRLTW